MWSVTLSVAAFSLLAIQGSALLESRSPLARLSLFSRQSINPTSIPPACNATCAPIEATINVCQDVSCLCNNVVAQQVASCADCLVAIDGSESASAQASEQQVVDQYNAACATNGDGISSIIVSSVAPSGTLSSTSASQADSSSSTSPSPSAGSPTSNNALRTSSLPLSGTNGGILGLICACITGAIGTGVLLL